MANDIRETLEAVENEPSIIAALRPGSRIVLVKQHGATNWSTGMRIVTQRNNKEEIYFLKVTKGEGLVGMAEAEYEGQKALSAVILDNTVPPIAWGYFQNNRTISWFLTEFRDLVVQVPPLLELASAVRKLHRESESPTGKFGFHVTPFYGPPPMVVDWTDNWEFFWSREFRSGLQYLQKKRGPDPELMEVGEVLLAKVVTRLLRPLQTGGRNIKPSLLHGDLWHGNIQMDVDTGRPIIFDPCPFYGHHEMDLQCMRSDRYAIGKEFIELYKEEEGAVSEPREDFDDRNALYAIRNDIMTAGMWPNRVSMEDVKGEMRQLIAKHPEGLVGFKGDMTPTT